MILRVLGIDPGTAVTGYAIVDAKRSEAALAAVAQPADRGPGRLIECGVIRTNSREPTWQRLEALYDGVALLIERHRPSAVAIEGIFYAKNVKTTISLSHARGVMILAAVKGGVEIAEFPPATVKKTVVGVGGATKEQVGFMVQRLLGLTSIPSPNDAADACAIALTYLLKSRVLV